MGFRFQRRLNLGSGLGLNLGKRGVSGSARTFFGSVGTRGFSVRSGLPGISYRKSWGRGVGGALVGLVMMFAVLAVNLVSLFLLLGVNVLIVLCQLLWVALVVGLELLLWILLTLVDFARYMFDQHKGGRAAEPSRGSKAVLPPPLSEPAATTTVPLLPIHNARRSKTPPS